MRRTEPYFVPEDDGVRVSLFPHEREVLAGLVTDLRHLLMADDHELLRRLKPPAHPGDDEAEIAYREMIDDELLRGRLEGLDIVEATMDGGVLDDAAVAAWMQALTNLRLVLGERLAGEGHDLTAPDLGDTPTAIVYGWIGELLEWLVRAASAG